MGDAGGIVDGGVSVDLHFVSFMVLCFSSAMCFDNVWWMVVFQ